MVVFFQNPSLKVDPFTIVDPPDLSGIKGHILEEKEEAIQEETPQTPEFGKQSLNPDFEEKNQIDNFDDMNKDIKEKERTQDPVHKDVEDKKDNSKKGEMAPEEPKIIVIRADP